MSKQQPSAMPWYQTGNPVPRKDKTIAVIGAGIAGCTVAAALRHITLIATLFEIRWTPADVWVPAVDEE